MNESEHYCYICIPITDREHDVYKRANIAKEEVKKLGYIPISPLDLNQEVDNLASDDYWTKIGYYMGQDIQTIIEKCDAIYCCEGWQYSKGCNVERECAKQYNRTILYQIPYDYRNDIKLLDCLRNKRNVLTNKFCDLAKVNSNSDECKLALDEIYNFTDIVEKYFNVYLTEDFEFKFR